VLRKLASRATLFAAVTATALFLGSCGDLLGKSARDGVPAGVLAISFSDPYEKNVQLVTPDGKHRGVVTEGFLPSWSPDDERLAYVKDGAPSGRGLFVAYADGSSPSLVVSNPSNSAWSPNGMKIAVSSSDPTPGSRHHDLNVFDVTDGSLLHIAEGSGGLLASWSSDSNKIAYVEWDSGNLYVIDADGTNRTLIAGNVYPSSITAWSGDGKTIAFFTGDSSSGYTVLLANSDGSGVTEIAERYPVPTLAWSPDGADSLLLDPAGLNRSFEIVRRDGPNSAWTAQEVVGSFPRWSPDGSQIMFVRHSPPGVTPQVTPGMYIMDADGSNEMLIFDEPSGGVWSPDGSQLAFHRSDGIYVIERDGQGLLNLTSSQDDYDFWWSPAGSYIAFLSYRDGIVDQFISGPGREPMLYSVRSDGSDLQRLTSKDDRIAITESPGLSTITWVTTRQPQRTADGPRATVEPQLTPANANPTPEPQPTSVRPTPTPGPNLLYNSSFKDGLTGWHSTAELNPSDSSVWKAEIDADRTVVRGEETSSRNLGRFYQDVTTFVELGQSYVIGGWLRTVGVSGLVVIGAAYVSTDGWTTSSSGIAMELGYLSGDSDWTYFESDPFLIPPSPGPEATTVWFYLDFNNGNGAAWFDDLFLMEVTE
jgi:Tol biopolymer transport system component